LRGLFCVTYIKPEPKSARKTFSTLQAQFAYLSPKSNAAQSGNKNPGGGGGGGGAGEDFLGEYQTVLDQEFFDFILYEVPWVVT
jgi:V-type H+-transporting ATPase subunit C